MAPALRALQVPALSGRSFSVLLLCPGPQQVQTSPSGDLWGPGIATPKASHCSQALQGPFRRTFRCPEVSSVRCSRPFTQIYSNFVLVVGNERGVTWSRWTLRPLLPSLCQADFSAPGGDCHAGGGKGQKTGDGNIHRFP